MLLLLAACAPKVLPQPPAEHPLLLWRVERAGHASHLLGTCHVGVSLDYALPAPHDTALTTARVVYTEAALDLDDPARLVNLLWTDGPGLSERIPDADWRAVAHAVRGSLPAPLFEHMEPWALASILPMVASGTDLGKSAKGGMDLDIQKRAKARGIPLAYVETIEEQAAMLGAWNDTFLASIGPTEGSRDAESDALTALCMRADTSSVDALFPADDPTTGALLDTRNHAWMPKLLPDLAEGGAFVAVGAAHMLGPNGLLSLLRAEGYTITQLTTDRPVSDGRMPPASANIPPAPPAPPDLDAMSRDVADSFASKLCAEGQLMRVCFEPDGAACTQRVATDARLCLRQYDDQLPTGGEAPSKELLSNLTACAPTGLVIEALATNRITNAPMCTMLKTAMGAAYSSKEK